MSPQADADCPASAYNIAYVCTFATCSIQHLLHVANGACSAVKKGTLQQLQCQPQDNLKCLNALLASLE